MPNRCVFTPGDQQIYYDDSGNEIFRFNFLPKSTSAVSPGSQFNPSASANTVGNFVVMTSRFRYSYALDGGTGVSKYISMEGDNLPVGAVVHSGAMYVKTAITGCTNLSIQLVAQNDIVTAAAISGAPWSSTGWKAPGTYIVPVLATVGSYVTVVTASVPQLLYTGTGPITAGYIILYLNWYMVE